MSGGGLQGEVPCLCKSGHSVELAGQAFCWVVMVGGRATLGRQIGSMHVTKKFDRADNFK